MNNKRRLWRIHHSSNIDNGVYYTLSLFKKENKLTPNHQNLLNLLNEKEPINFERNSYNNLIQRLNKKENRKNYNFPSSFFLQRPGFFEDPILKSNIIKKYGKLTYFQEFRFAFDSLNQLQNWFDDKEELIMLLENDFTISDFLIEEKNIIHGHRQCIYFKNK